MKKLLQTFSDVFLFSLLIIIFLMPLLVSFNLDPKLYIDKAPQIAGASDVITSSEIDFDIEENFTKSQRITIQNSSKSKNIYEVEFKVNNGGKLEDTLDIGKVTNNSNHTLRFVLNLFSDNEALKGIKVVIGLKESEYTLFNGETSESLEFSLNPQAQENLQMKLISDFPINYDQDMKLELRALSTT